MSFPMLGTHIFYHPIHQNLEFLKANGPGNCSIVKSNIILKILIFQQMLIAYSNLT